MTTDSRSSTEMLSIDYNVKIRKEVGKLSEGHWPAWSRRIMFSFMEAGLSGYLKGEIEEPADAKELAEWKMYNSRIIGTLGRNVDGSLAQELNFDMTAAQAWTMLRERTCPSGTIAKVNAMRTTLNLKFSRSKPTNTTISEMRDLLTCIYVDNVAPTREEWFLCMVLHALDGTEYDWLKKTLVARYTGSDTKPTESDIIDTLNFAARYGKGTTEQIRHSETPSFSASKSKDVNCSNCGNSRHTLESCWQEGGGQAGKAPDWWKATQEKRAGKSKSRARRGRNNSGGEERLLLR